MPSGTADEVLADLQAGRISFEEARRTYWALTGLDLKNLAQKGRDPELGSPAKQIMTMPQFEELSRAFLQGGVGINRQPSGGTGTSTSMSGTGDTLSKVRGPRPLQTSMGDASPPPYGPGRNTMGAPPTASLTPGRKQLGGQGSWEGAGASGSWEEEGPKIPSVEDIVGWVDKHRWPQPGAAQPAGPPPATGAPTALTGGIGDAQLPGDMMPAPKATTVPTGAGPRSAPSAPPHSPAATPGLGSMELAAPEPSSAPMNLAAMAHENIAKDARKAGSPAWALPLIMAGLSMAASKNPNILGAAAEGGIAGVQTMMINRRQDREDANLERQISQGDRRLGLEQQGVGIQQQQADEAARAHKAATDLAYKQLGDTAQYRKDYIDALKSRSANAGSNRAPSRPEVYAQLLQAYAKAGAKDPAAMAAKRMHDIYGAGTSANDPRLSAGWANLDDDEKQSILEEMGIGNTRPDPTAAFFDTPPPDDSVDFSAQ